MPTIPDRVRWAVDLLDAGPTESVLEVGGGPGVSAGLICARLTTGRLLAVDRSAVAVRRTVERGAEHLAAGRLAVEQAELGDLTVPTSGFDAALTLDVNLFWTRDPAPELAVLRRVLRPGGRLLVLYGAGPAARGRVLQVVAAALEQHGFGQVDTVSAVHGFGVTGRAP